MDSPKIIYINEYRQTNPPTEERISMNRNEGNLDETPMNFTQYYELKKIINEVRANDYRDQEGPTFNPQPIWVPFILSSWAIFIALVMIFTATRALLFGVLGALVTFLLRQACNKAKHSGLYTFLCLVIGFATCVFLICKFVANADAWTFIGAFLVVYLGVGIPRIIEVIKE